MATLHPSTFGSVRRRPGLLVLIAVYVIALCCADSAISLMLGAVVLATALARTVLVSRRVTRFER